MNRFWIWVAVTAVVAAVVGVLVFTQAPSPPTDEQSSPPPRAVLPDAAPVPSATDDPLDEATDGPDGGDPTETSPLDEPERTAYVPEAVRENPPEGHWYVLDAYTGEWMLLEDSWLVTAPKANDRFGWDVQHWQDARAAGARFASTVGSYSAEKWADESYRAAARLATPRFGGALDERARQVGVPSQGDIDAGVVVDASVDYAVLVESSAIGDVGTVDDTHAVVMVVWRTWTKEGASGAFQPQGTTTTTWYQLVYDEDAWLVDDELDPVWPEGDEHAHGD